MKTYPTLYLTHRGERHQRAALRSAPDHLEITMRRDPPKAEVIELLPGKQFLISEREGQISREVIKAGKDLRLIQRLGTQPWDIDLHAAREAGIPVCIWPVPSSIAVAEHILLQILALLRNLEDLQRVMHNAKWEKESRRSNEDTYAYNWTGRQNVRWLWQRKLGILGFGEIGTELTRRLRGFGVEILYYKRSQLPPDAEHELGIQYSQPDEILRTCEIVCSLLPFSKATDQSINEDFFEQMEPDSYFVHCGGSGVVDETALQAALTTGKLAGAALDTYTWEPLPGDSPLLALAEKPDINLLLTPHVAAGADPDVPDERKLEYTNVERVLAGKELFYRLV